MGSSSVIIHFETWAWSWSWTWKPCDHVVLLNMQLIYLLGG